MFGVLRVETRVFHLLNQLMVGEGSKCAFEKDEKDNFSTCVCVCFVTTQGHITSVLLYTPRFPFIIIKPPSGSVHQYRRFPVIHGSFITHVVYE